MRAKILTGLLLVAACAWSVSFSTVESEGTLTVAGVSTFQAATVFPVGAAATPSIYFAGSATSGFYGAAADSPAVSVATANVGTWDATGYQGNLGQTTPAAADVTTLTTTGLTDLFAGAVGAPSVFYTGSATSGYYQAAADELGVAILGGNVGTWDATGLGAVGFNGPIGTVTPAQGDFTDIYGTADFYYGPDPGDMHTGYRRTETVKYIDTFDVGNNADLAVRWNVAGVVGAGTNDETTTDGWNTLITGGGGGPDMESTVTNGLNHYRAYEPRLECSVDLTAVAAGQTFYFGFYAAANEFAEIIHEPATSANWLIRVDDTGGATTHDSGILAVAGTPTKLEIWVDATGVVGAAIDDVEVAVAGLDPMTANAHYAEWRILDVAAAAHTVAVDYFISEQLKMQ